MSDITKHKFSDTDIGGVSVTTKGSIALLIYAGNCTNPIIQERDAIAITKHFYEQLSIVDQISFISSITGLVDIKSSDTIADNHLCNHPYGQCKIVKTSTVVPNGFNIVIDKDDPCISHVLQLEGNENLPRYDESTGEIMDGYGTIYDLVEKDIKGTIEIGKIYQSNEQPHISLVKRIPQSETTYINHDFGNSIIGEMKRND